MRIAAQTAWKVVGAGLDFSCALGAGQVQCWGTSYAGETGTTRPAVVPTRVDDSGDDNWAALSAGRRHSCGIRYVGNQRTIWCWGDNGGGQAGGGVMALMKPTQVGTATDWAQVSAGDSHTCAIRIGGELWCWGGGATAPLHIGLTTWSVASVGGKQTCGIGIGNGKLACGSNLKDAAMPVSAFRSVGDTWFSVDVGVNHACSFVMTGGLNCWGENTYGQLGTGTREAVDVPMPVTLIGYWTAVSAGEDFTCGIRKETYCWGHGHRGQLGTGQGSRPLPERVLTP